MKLCRSISPIVEGSNKSQTTIGSNSKVSTISVISKDTSSETTPTPNLTNYTTGTSYLEIDKYSSFSTIPMKKYQNLQKGV